MNLRRLVITGTILVFISTVLSLFGCTKFAPNEASSTGGTGSEVVGVVEYPEESGVQKRRGTFTAASHPLINGSVFINPRTYLADTSHGGESTTIFTSADGSFRISRVLPGEHLIYIRDLHGNAVAKTIVVPEESTTVDCGTLFAKKTAGVSIAYTGATPGDVLFFIDVRGTGLQARCTGRGISIQLDKIPTGIDHIVALRVYKPFERSYDIKSISLLPDMIRQLESITGDN